MQLAIRRSLRFALLLAVVCPASAQTDWPSADRGQQRQRVELQLRQYLYRQLLPPLAPARQAELARSLAMQRRAQRDLQAQRQNQAAQALQRQHLAPGPAGAAPSPDALLWQRELRRQQLHWDLQRRSWPYSNRFR